MTSVTKLGIASIVGAIVAPAYLVNSQRYDVSESIPNHVENAHAFLTKHGYHEKNAEELVDFAGTRDSWEGGNFALGCHRLLFGGKNVPKLADSGSVVSWNSTDKGPRADYFGDEKQPVLGCSTAALLNGSNKQVYEFELALKRGDRGFLERITVWDNMAISQLIFLRKNEDYSTRKQHPWVGIDAIQRTTYNWSFIENETKPSNWDLLEIKGKDIKTPQYFVVWTGDKKNQESSNNKGIFEEINKQVSYVQENFSSIVGSYSDSTWGFGYFEHDSNKLNPKHTHSPHRMGPNYTSKIEEEVKSLKGSWKNVKDFCDSQLSLKEKEFSGENLYRLRDYCYTNQTANSVSRNKQAG